MLSGYNFVEASLTFEVVFPIVIIDGCDTGVTDQVLGDGSTISENIEECAAGAGNHGGFVRCVAHLANDLVRAGHITGAEKDAIQSCAAQADIP